MPELYSYCIPWDDGGAPNPFWGTCTLTICKPAIRRTAKAGDYIIGLGSKKTPTLSKDFSGKAIYIMRVTDKKTLSEYDTFCKKHLPLKIPNWASGDKFIMVGDCIYDYSGNEPIQREGVHDSGNIKNDISGNFALLSNDFLYFGRDPVSLPKDLEPLIKQSQGHKVKVNRPNFNNFIDWYNDLKRIYKPCTILALPEMWDDISKKPCSKLRACEEDEEE